MKMHLISSLAVAVGLLTTAVFADSPPAANKAASATEATSPTGPEKPVPDMVIYAPQLPTVASLTKSAKAQGLEIKQIIKEARELTVTYNYPDGKTKTVLYQLLGDAATAQTTRTASPPVVYATPPPPVYHYYPYYDPYYDPYYGPYYYGGFAYPSVSFGFGVGGFDDDDFHHGFRRGDHDGFHGGFHGGYRGGFHHR